MTRLRDVGERAMTCVRCHVGSPADGSVPRRDVNHDLIAAGHPRLNFDFATAMERLPAHWVEKERDDFEVAWPRHSWEAAWYWRVGRHAANVAAYQLLADRAALGVTEPRAWPELAELDCFACHRGLDPDRKNFSRPPVRFAAGLSREAPALLHAVDRNIPRTDALEALIRKPGQSPAEIKKLADAAADEWREAMRTVEDRNAGRADAKTIAKAFAAADTPATWAEACQRFYALDYLNCMGKRGLDKELEAVRPLLQFQRDPVEVNSPATADLTAAGRKLRAIAERLSQPAPPAPPDTK